MSAITLPPPFRKHAVAPPREKRWTCEEFHFLGEHGFLEGQRAKLIHGVILEEGPMNHPHALSVTLADQAIR